MQYDILNRKILTVSPIIPETWPRFKGIITEVFMFLHRKVLNASIFSYVIWSHRKSELTIPAPAAQSIPTWREGESTAKNIIANTRWPVCLVGLLRYILHLTLYIYVNEPVCEYCEDYLVRIWTQKYCNPTCSLTLAQLAQLALI